MSQKSFMTTSFTISSNESLTPLSSSQSTASSDNMTSSDSIQNNQYFIALTPVDGDMARIQRDGLQSTELSSQPLYGQQTPNYGIHATTPNGLVGNYPNANYQRDADRECEKSSNDQAVIYGIYGQNNVNSQPLQAFDTSSQQSQLYGSVGDRAFQSNGIQVSSDQNLSINPDFQQNNGSFPKNSNGTYTTKSKHSIQSFYKTSHLTNAQRSPTSSVDSSQNSLMPINVKGMLLHGVANHEVMKSWLTSIKCEEYLPNFINQGYDTGLLTTMTPQDLAAIGVKSPSVRKKLLMEIKKLNLEDDIPDCRPHSFEHWLELLRLSEYQARLCDEGYDSIDKLCELTWEDLEEIGINKLGHQKRLLLGIERVRNFDREQEDRQNEYAIYDVNPNHRVTLHKNKSENRLSTISRSAIRTGFFQTRSGANLDHRGLPVATVRPASKQLNNSLAALDISMPTTANSNDNKYPHLDNNSRNNTTLNQSHNDCRLGNSEQGLFHNDSTSTLKRIPPPLPPVRSDSLKMPIGSSMQNNYSIYGNFNGVSSANGGNNVPLTVGPTSFLRTPKLGTLTATTNKMLMHGGHIQTVCQSAIPMMPLRDAPQPPSVHSSVPPVILERTEDEQTNLDNYRSSINTIGDPALINSSLIGHQLASADEFPPPPPS